MKIFDCKSHKVSRNFLVAASAYRRMVKGNFDFSPQAMREQYEHETFGKPSPDMNTNGYTYGKSILGITIAAMKEDLASGLMCKYDLKKGSCFFVRNFISGLMPVGLFPWVEFDRKYCVLFWY